MNDGAVPRGHGRRGRRGFILFALAGVAVLAGLGTWQLDRLQWKRGLIAEREAAFRLPPLRLAGDPAEAAAAAWRRVTVAGTFLHDKETLVGPRARRGEPGWHVVTPLRLANGRIVLVDRGWVPEDRKDPAHRPAGGPAGPVTVEGIVKRPAARGWFAPPNQPSRGEWFHVDPAALAVHLDLTDVAPWWVEAIAASGAGVYPVAAAGLVLPSDNHLQYAMTWYSLAVALAIIAVLRTRATHRSDGA